MCYDPRPLGAVPPERGNLGHTFKAIMEIRMTRQTFSQKRVWHSFLKSKSPLTIRLKGDPMDSKYGDNPIVYFDVNGDDFDGYYYEIEHDYIGEVVDKAPKGVWLAVTAGGGQDGQTLSFAPGTGAEIKSGLASANYKGSTDDGKDYSTGNISGDYQRCLDEARGICLGWADDFDSAIPAEAVHAMAATLFINWSYTKFRRPLNADDAETVEVVVEDKTQEYVTEITELMESLPITSGTSHDDLKLKTTLDKFRDTLEGTISAELHGRIVKWLTDEHEYQMRQDEEGEYTDDLPF